MSSLAAAELEGPQPAAGNLPSAASSSAATNSQAAHHWGPASVFLSIFLFVLAGVAEIGGGWLVWQAVRESRPWWWGIFGALVLVTYGFIPTAQPVSDFGRVYAVYGGFFILLSYLWGWALDGVRPDKGDWIGAGIALAGVALAWFWPR